MTEIKESQENQKIIQEKALSINLDPNKYGTFVEIGAGQEVARQFFTAGGAAGTVAKTMSAYDMQISDEIYGKASRYVSRDRLEQMLEKEYSLLESRLCDHKPKETQYFAYAATVTARSYSQKNECHGWVGIRIQLMPETKPSDIVMHVRMLDETNTEQCEALGVLGVNLVHGAYNHFNKPKELIDALLDGLDKKRLEVDMINFSGPGFDHIDNRLINLHLIRSWCCRAVMFSPDGNSLVPGSILRKNDTLIIRGSFKPPTKVTVDMIEGARQQFMKEEGVESDNVHIVTELTLHQTPNGDVDSDEDFLARVDMMNAVGYTVLVSDYFRFFRLRSWLRRHNHNELGIVLSVMDFDALFNEQFYEGLEGGILEAMGKLFSDNTHIYIYPTIEDGKLITLDEVSVKPEQKFLLKHLIKNGKMVAVENYNEAHLHISSRAALKQIQSGDEAWKESVPKDIKRLVIEGKLFGYTE
jgi:hypothetical protein